MPQTRIDETRLKPSLPAESAARATLRPSRRCARVARAWARRHTQRMRTWFRRTQRERSSESSIVRAMADAEQIGLRLHLRVQLAVLAVVAVWLCSHYSTTPLGPG